VTLIFNLSEGRWGGGGGAGGQKEGGAVGASNRLKVATPNMDSQKLSI
jgi:hypothetical protein